MTTTIDSNDERFDTVVIGGGITGLFAARFLAEDGAAVVCLDDGSNAGTTANAGSLHGQMQSRMERLFPERVADYEKTLSIYPRAIDYWSEIAADLDCDIDYQICGGLMIAETAAHLEALKKKSEIENRCGIQTTIVDKIETLALAPFLDEAVVAGALLCPKEGKVNPLTATAAVRRSAMVQGAEIVSGRFVHAIHAAAGGYRVVTDAGNYRVARIVVAAGAGSGKLLQGLGVDMPVVAEPLHMNVTEPCEPLIAHLLQHAELALTMKQLKNGQLVIGGGWPARRNDDGSPPDVVAGSVFGNLALARRLVPRVAGLRLLRTWAGINPMVDLLSVIGPLPGWDGVHVLIPGDAGYTLAPYCARLVTEQIAGRRPDYPLDALSPSRFC